MNKRLYLITESELFKLLDRAWSDGAHVGREPGEHDEISQAWVRNLLADRSFFHQDIDTDYEVPEGFTHSHDKD
jgi:hypothetical protein